MMRPLHWLALLVAILAMPVHAQEVGDPSAGRAFAFSVCAECHFVGEGQLEMPSFDAPPFAAVAADPAVTELGLRVFLQTPHDRMPNIILSQDETDNVIAYILSLRHSP